MENVFNSGNQRCQGGAGRGLIFTLVNILLIIGLLSRLVFSGRAVAGTGGCLGIGDRGNAESGIN